MTLTMKPHAAKRTHRLPPPFGRTTAWIAGVKFSNGNVHWPSCIPHGDKASAMEEARKWIELNS